MILSSAARRNALLRMRASRSSSNGRNTLAPRARRSGTMQERVVRLHHDVGRAQVDLVGAQLALDDQVAAVDRAAVGDLRAGQDAGQGVLAGLGGFVQVRVPFADPVLVRLAVLPHGVGGDRGDADEQVDVAHGLAEHQRRDVGERRCPPGAVEATVEQDPVRAAISCSPSQSARTCENRARHSPPRGSASPRPRRLRPMGRAGGSSSRAPGTARTSAGSGRGARRSGSSTSRSPLRPG